MTVQELAILVLATPLVLAYVNAAWRLRPLGFGIELWVFLVLASAAAAAGPMTRLGAFCVVGAASVAAGRASHHLTTFLKARQEARSASQLTKDRLRLVSWLSEEVRSESVHGLIAVVPVVRGPLLEFNISSLRPLYESDDDFTAFERQIETFIEMVHSTLGAVVRRRVDSKANVLGDLAMMREDEVFVAALLADGRWVMVCHRRATEEVVRALGAMDISRVKQAMLRVQLVDLFTLSAWRPQGYESGSDSRIVTVGSVERLDDVKKRAERARSA